MSGTINKVILIGYLGDNIKMYHFEGGGCVGNVSLATNESYTNKQTGEKITETEWHQVVVRNKQAEVFEKYLSKGDKIYVEGRIKTRKWKGEDGKDRYSKEVQVTSFTFLSTKGNNEQYSGDSNASSADDIDNLEPIDDDLPF